MARQAATRKKLPTHVYDFTSGSLTPWRGDWAITYSRTGSQYSLDSNGYYSAKTTNNPAYTYEKGLVIVQQKTNQLKYSSDLSNALWVTSAVNKGTTVTGPDNQNSAVLMTPTTGNVPHYWSQVSSVTTGVYYLMSIVCKAGGYGFIQMTGSTGFDTTPYVNFNLTTGAISGTAGTVDYWTKYLGNGFWQCTIGLTATSTNASGRFIVAHLVTGAETRSPTFIGDGSSGVYVTMCEFGPNNIASENYLANVASTSTTYQPTVSSTLPHYVTSGDSFSLYLDVYKHFSPTLNKIDAPAVFELKQNSSNYYTLLCDQTTANVKQNLVLSGASDFGTNTSFSWTQDTRIKYMITYDGTNTWKLYANGSLLRTDTANGEFAPTTLELAKTISTMYGSFTYRKIAFWNFAHNATDAAAYTTYGW